MKRDIALLAVVLAVCAAAYGLLLLRPSAESVKIFVDGQLQKTFLLADNTEYIIKTPYGANTLIIQNKTARIAYSDCPNGLCRGATIVRRGESIICAPHHLLVTTGRAAGVDAVSG